MTNRPAIDRSFWLTVAVLTLIAAALRILYLEKFGLPLPQICDASGYFHMGRQLADGHGFVNWTAQEFKQQTIPSAGYPPLYPAFLALLQLIGVKSVEAQRLVVVAFGAVQVPIIAALGRGLFGRNAGLAAAALAALSPALIEIDGSFMTEGLYAIFVSLSMLAIVWARSAPEPTRWGGVGLLLGLATLTRPEGVVLFGSMVLPIALIKRRAQPLRARIFATVIACMGLGLVVAPWTIRNAIQMDAFIPVSLNAKGAIVGANCKPAYRHPDHIGGWLVPCVSAVNVEGLNEVETFDKFQSVGINYALGHRDRWPQVVEARVLRTWGLFRPGKWFGLGPSEIRSYEFSRRTMWTGWGLIALAPIGLFLAARWDPLHAWMLAAPILTVTLTSAIGYGNPRFRAAAEPSLVLLAGLVVVSAWGLLRKRFAKSP